MKISYEQIESYSQELQKLAEDIKENLDSVSEKSKLVVKNSWTGTASEYYSDKFKAFSSNFNDVYNEIYNAAFYLREVVENYKSIDEQISNQITNSFNSK